MWKLAALAAIALIGLIAFNASGVWTPASAGIFLPPAGTDELDVNGQVTIDLPFTGLGPEEVLLTGSMEMERDDPDPASQTIEIEIVELSLTGDSSLLGPNTPVEVSLNPSALPAVGQIDASMDFPAESFFDVFFVDINIGEFGHFAQNPIHMSSQITGIPPYGDKFGSGQIDNPIIDNREPNPQVGSLLDFNIDIKPPEKLFSITVLKLNDETQQPLSGWDMDLYQGEGCSGSPIDSGTTDSDGLVDFTGLQPGSYSVEEEVRSGWNPADDILCQDVTVGGAVGGSAGFVTCPTQPDADFPAAGCDEFDSGAQVNVEINATGEIYTITLNGPTVIERGPVVPGTIDTIETEIIQLDLAGTSPVLGPVTLRQSPDTPSLGAIEEQENDIQGELDFPADSFFDVFFEVDVLGLTLHNEDPFLIECKIDEIPPIGCFYQPPVPDPVPLFDESGIKIATIVHGLHIPLPPNEVLVVFRNERKPTPTPTSTPPEKLFSITVLKLDDETNAPLDDFEFNLYAGTGCSGTPIDSGATDADGLLDFTGLQPGSYSVQEKARDGWNVVGENCQEVELGRSAGSPAGFVTCPTQPDADFPAAGCDEFDSGAQVNVEINATGEIHAVTLNGPTVIERGPVGDNEPNGMDDVQTEIIQLDLTGSLPLLGPVTLRQSPDTPSLGAIEEQENDIQGVIDFPADSFFDVFFEVDVLGMTLHNEDPFRIECKIDDIPPIGCFYQPPVPDPIPLFDDSGVKIATIVHGLHIPLPPNEVLVVFINRRKPTPTPTPTQTGLPGEPTATATPTRPPGEATATPTNTPAATPTRTNTPTPTQPPPNGDANKDGTTNSIDATLVLQHVAGLIGPRPNSDVNQDGETTSVDATLILQFVADLIPGLPV